MAQAIREVAWNAANDPQKCPVKTGVSRAEIVAPAFECSVDLRDGCEVIQGPPLQTPRVGTDAFTRHLACHEAEPLSGPARNDLHPIQKTCAAGPRPAASPAKGRGLGRCYPPPSAGFGVY